jgi:hypothetical protein
VLSCDEFAEKSARLLLEIAGDEDEQLEFVENFWCRESEHAYESFKEAA